MDEKKRFSRLERHLHLTGLEPNANISDKELEEDRKLMESADLPAWDERLSPAKENLWDRLSEFFQLKHAMGIIAVAALVAVILIPKEEPVSLIPKGDWTMRVYVERSGKVTNLSPGEFVMVGDRVRIEVTVVQPSAAFLYYVDRKGSLMSSVTDVQSSRITLTANQTKTFAGSVEITGESEGETAVVMLCPAGWTTIEPNREIPKECSVNRIVLRR